VQCRNCNTRFDAAAGVCQNCGWHPPGMAPRPVPRPGSGLPPLAPEAAEGAPEPELPVSRERGGHSPEPASAVPAPEEPATAPEAARAEPRRGEPAPPSEPAAPASPPAPSVSPAFAPGPGSARPPARPEPGAFTAPDPGALRTLLAQRPELLEPGLEVVRDERGTPVGAGYATGVGDIDLLARDTRGRWVVVLVAEPGQGEELVAGVLQRIGWVRKHLGDAASRVRGIVLVEEPPAGLSYAAAAVSDTVAFKTWRIALSFTDLEV